MGLSEAANNAIGALSVGWMSIVGAILAACLVPQLVRMARTRSAKDLSYLFLIFYNIGLVLMAVYLIYSNATVGWITIIIELALGLSTLAGKFYLDTKFPSDRRLHASDAKAKPIADSVNLEYHSPISSHFFMICDMERPPSLQNLENTRQSIEASNLEQRRSIVEALQHALLEAGMANVLALNPPDSCDNDSTKVTILVVEDGYVCISWSKGSECAILNFIAFNSMGLALNSAARTFGEGVISRGIIKSIKTRTCRDSAEKQPVDCC